MFPLTSIFFSVQSVLYFSVVVTNSRAMFYHHKYGGFQYSLFLVEVVVAEAPHGPPAQPQRHRQQRAALARHQVVQLHGRRHQLVRARVRARAYQAAWGNNAGWDFS